MADHDEFGHGRVVVGNWQVTEGARPLAVARRAKVRKIKVKGVSTSGGACG